MAVLAEIRWVANPFRGDAFAAGWRPGAELVMDFGAHSWEFFRAIDGKLDFIQHAVFDSKHDFERYWYSDEVGDLRTELSGLYQVPLLPAFFEIVGSGKAQPVATPE
jgi:hypothetical protein